MAALVRTFRVKGLNDPKTPVGVVSFRYQEGPLVVRMFRPNGNWMPAFAYLEGQPREEFYRGSGLDQTFFVSIQKEDSTRVGHVLEYTTSEGVHVVDLELVDANDDEWPLSETPLVPQGEDPAFPNTKIPRRQFHPVELSVTVGGLEPEGPATFYSQDLRGEPAGRNYTIFSEGRWDHFHEPPASVVWVRASKDGKDFVGNIVLPAGSSRVALDFDPETGDMTADVVLFPPSQSPLQEFGGSIRRVAPGYKAPEVYTLEVQITKEGVPTPSAMKSMYVYRSQQDTSPAAIYQLLNGFNEKQYFSEAILGDWFVQAMDEEPPRLGSLRWPSITQQDTVLRFDLSESQQVRPDPGIGILSGSFPLSLLTDKDSAPSQAVVRVLYRPEEGHPGDGVLITTTTCNADGTWQVAGLNENEKFDVVARIRGYNDVLISNVQPTGAPLSAHFANLKEEYEYQEEVEIQVVALGGIPPYSYTAINLPDGLELDPTSGLITGSIPYGDIDILVEVSDSVGDIIQVHWEGYVIKPLPSVIGEEFGGGYYIGNITIADGGEDDGEYAIIMGRSESQSDNLAWKNSSSSTPGTVSTTNGMANTLAMQADSPTPHHAGMYCLGYSGGGFDDWYMPAKDELNLAWVNHSLLAVLAMEGHRYWSSTEDSGHSGWDQMFNSGIQSVNTKNWAFSVRPVRRLKI